MVVTLDDITNQHQAPHELALAERAMRLTFDHASTGVATMAVDGQFLRADPALCRLLGRSEEQLLAGSLADVAHPDERTESERRSPRR